MSAPVQFDLLEQHKENIQPLKQGRSALALVSTLTQNPIDARSRQDEERELLEKRLAEAEDLDDPLEAYLDYIKWTNDNYPMGSTSDSGLINLLERTIDLFRDDAMYKNDARFLRVWLQYIKFYEDPKEIFSFMAKKGVGKNLSTFYEEYAGFLESIGKVDQAKNIYEVGIADQARPLERLQRRYQEFLERCSASSSSLPLQGDYGLPVVRPALGVLDSGREGGLSSEPAQKDKPKNKLQVFSDSGAPSSVSNPESASGQLPWGSIGTLNNRRKENVMAAKPWAGETLQMGNDYSHQKSRPAPVYRDDAKSGERRERIAVAVQYLTDENDEELCLEEMLAKARGILRKSFERSDSHQIGIKQSNGWYYYGSCMSCVKITNLQEPTTRRPASPTMTAFTKAATEDVYDMFNQPLKPDNNDSDDDSDSDNSSSDSESENYQIDADPDHSSWGEELAEVHQDSRSGDHTHQAKTESLLFLTPIKETSEPEISQTITRSSNGNVDGEINIVNAASEESRAAFSARINSFLSSHQYIALEHNFHRASELQHALPFQSKNGNVSLSKMTVIEPTPGDFYCLRKCIGSGGFGRVYLAETATGEYKAIKVEKSCIPWEFYLMKQVEQRLCGTRDIKSIIHADRLYQFADESYLVMDYLPHGTSLDMYVEGCSLYETNGLPEVVVIFFAIELIRIVNVLHQNHIIHGDMKSDNVMVRLDPRLLTDRHYKVNGANGWSEQGVVLIDFGRGIDLTLYSPNTRFIGDWKMDNEDCQEMRDGKPWTFQSDYYGLAGILYTLLFGQKINTVGQKQPDGSIFYKSSQSFKRYWQKELWTDIFDILLNPTIYCTQTGSHMPLVSSLNNCQTRMENWLEANCESHSNSLSKSLQDLSEKLYNYKN